MAAFRKRLNMNPKASTSDLFDALETEALKTTAPELATQCATTLRKAIWAALGLESRRQAAVARLVEDRPAGCAKAVVEALSHGQDFPSGPDTGRHPHRLQGPDKFCTTTVEFEIQGRQNCKARGLVEAGFAETRVKGLQGFTAHVSENGLVYHAQGLFRRIEIAQLRVSTMLARGKGFAHLAAMHLNPFKAVAPDLRHVEAWIFDLDNTLYRADSDLFAQIDVRMCDFCEPVRWMCLWTKRSESRKDYYRARSRHDAEWADQSGMTSIRKAFWISSTTSTFRCSRLTRHSMRPLRGCPGKHFVFTNGCRNYAQRVLERVGPGEFNRRPLGYPRDRVFAEAGNGRLPDLCLAGAGVAPDRCAMFEDVARNLVPAHELGMTTVWLNNGSVWSQTGTGLSGGSFASHRLRDRRSQ